MVAGIRPLSILNADWPEYSSPVYDGGVVFAGSIRGKLIALDLETGNIMWRKKVGGRVFSSPGAGNGKVFVGVEAGFVRAFNANDGEMIWEYKTKSPITSNIYVANDKVYFNAGNNVFYCLDAESGEWVWEYSHEVTKHMSVFGASEATIHNGVLFTGFADGTVVALNPGHGALLWRVKPDKAHRFEDVDAPILADAKRVYVSVYSGSTFALDRSDGSTIWRFEHSGVQGMAMGDRLVYLSSQDGKLYGLDKQNGEAKWTFAGKRRGRLTKPVLIKGRIAVACSYGHVHIVDPANGSETKTLKAPGSISSPLTVVNNKLLAFTGKGFLVAFSYP